MLSNNACNLSATPQIDRSIEAIGRLQRSDVNLVSWHRELPAGLDVQLEAWVRRDHARFDQAVAAQHPGDDLAKATSGLSGSIRDWLIADIADLLARLAALADARRMRVSFGAIRSDQCRKFHVDWVRYRLITTYLGPGTEWVPDPAVDRTALEHPADCPCDANKNIIRDATAVMCAAPGEVLLMKGVRHPDSPGTVHRSPPLGETGQVRVVLVASPIDGF